MRYHYVWLAWSSAFLLPWLGLFLANPRRRPTMWRASAITALFGFTEPLFVPRYWTPPSLFDLAQHTRFDVESLVFSFAIGGIGLVLYGSLTSTSLAPLSAGARHDQRHRFHRAALVLPLALFVPLYFLPWNPIYPSLTCLIAGAAATAMCRPDLTSRVALSGLLFFALYAAFMFGLRLLAPGYIEQVWNLPALSGVLMWGVPLEELVFGFAFGAFWGSVYEHLTWNAGA